MNPYAKALGRDFAVRVSASHGRSVVRAAAGRKVGALGWKVTEDVENSDLRPARTYAHSVPKRVYGNAFPECRE